jgi:hypothetical protein
MYSRLKCIICDAVIMYNVLVCLYTDWRGLLKGKLFHAHKLTAHSLHRNQVHEHGGKPDSSSIWQGPIASSCSAALAQLHVAELCAVLP